jgi:hypothetical protein
MQVQGYHPPLYGKEKIVLYWNEKSGIWFWSIFPKIPNEKGYGFLNISTSLMKNDFLGNKKTKRGMPLTAR